MYLFDPHLRWLDFLPHGLITMGKPNIVTGTRLLPSQIRHLSDRLRSCPVNRDTSRTTTGFGWGIIATVGMSTLMIVGYVTGRAPMPRPVLEAIALTLLGDGAPTPFVRILGVGAHLLYGGIFGAGLAMATTPVTVKKGLGLGIALWIVMEVVSFHSSARGSIATSRSILVKQLRPHNDRPSRRGILVDRTVRLRSRWFSAYCNRFRKRPIQILFCCNC